MWGRRGQAGRERGFGCPLSHCCGNSGEWEASVETPDLKHSGWIVSYSFSLRENREKL